MEYQIEEDLTPTDLELVVSNENGGFVIFKSKKEGKLYAVYQIKNGSLLGEKVVIEELSIGKYSREPTEEELKSIKENK